MVVVVVVVAFLTTVDRAGTRVRGGAGRAAVVIARATMVEKAESFILMVGGECSWVCGRRMCAE